MKMPLMKTWFWWPDQTWCDRKLLEVAVWICRRNLRRGSSKETKSLIYQKNGMMLVATIYQSGKKS